MLTISKSLYNELNKSINDYKLDYFKKKLLEILDKKEQEEKSVLKSCIEIQDILIKGGRAATIGEIRTWQGKKYKKMPDKKWVRVYDQRNRSSEISIARLKGKVRRAESVDELYNIVMKNVHRFTDSNGKTLDIVSELKAEVDKKKQSININKPKFDYEKARKEVAEKNKNSTSTYNNIDYDSLPEVFKSTKAAETFKNFCNFINTKNIKDNRVKKLMQNFGFIVNNRFGSNSVYQNNIKVVFTKNNFRYYPGNNEIHIPELKDIKNEDSIQSVLHEFGHCIDRSLLLTYEEKAIAEKPFRGKKLKRLSPEAIKYFKPYTGIDESMTSEYHRAFEKYQKAVYNNEMSVVEANKKLHSISDKIVKGNNTVNRLSDIYDALSGGEFLNNGVFYIGHGNDYKDVGCRTRETFANYLVIKIMEPKQLEFLQKDQPELCKYYDKLLDKAVERIDLLKGDV